MDWWLYFYLDLYFPFAESPKMVCV